MSEPAGAAGTPADAAPPAARARDIWLVAIAFGLVAALGELVIHAVRKVVFHQVLRLGLFVVWMAPLSDLLLFALLGLVLALYVRSARSAVGFHAAVLLLSAIAAMVIVRHVPLPSRVGQLAVGIVALAAVFVVLRWVLQSVGPWRTGVFVAAAAAGYAVMLVIPRIYPAAQWLVALGLGVRAAQLLEAEARATVWARRVLVALAGTFVVAGAAVEIWQRLHERRELAALPPAPAGVRNVILIIWDTVRASSLSLYGYARPTTPNLASLASRGARFDWAFAMAPWTLPSHAGIFTGHFEHELSTDFRVPLDGEFPTLAERLDQRGVMTAGFAANTYFCSLEFGLGRGFVHYEDYVVSPSELLLSSAIGRELASNRQLRELAGFYNVVGRRSADELSASFLQWVDRRPDRPFFAFLNYYDAHEPYLPPEPWRSKFGPQGARQLSRVDNSRLRVGTVHRRDLLGRAELQAEFDAYEGSIAYLDDRLGRLLQELDRRGLLRNSVVIVTSDHGEHHGEHTGIFGHNETVYTQETHVPLVIVAPDEPAVQVTAPVSLRDIAQTVLDLAHLGRDSVLPGRSLTRFWRDSVAALAAGDTVLTEFSKYRLTAVASGQRHLIRDAKGALQLYDLAVDPEEHHDLTVTPDGVQLARTMGLEYESALQPRHWRAPYDPKPTP